LRVVVTGGAGFVGSHVAEIFLERGDDVLVLDDLSTGARENVPARRFRGVGHR
jgi:UDP-glucose 4-epimerase